MTLCSSCQRRAHVAAPSEVGNGVDVWGEDPIIGYLTHFAASVHGFNYTLAHMTTTKLHNVFPLAVTDRPRRANWLLPATSIVVHGLKSRQVAQHGRWLRGVTSSFRRCFPPFLFHWQPATHTLHNPNVASWEEYMKLASRSTFGLHHLRNDSSAAEKRARVERFCASFEGSAPQSREAFS